MKVDVWYESGWEDGRPSFLLHFGHQGSPVRDTEYNLMGTVDVDADDLPHAVERAYFKLQRLDGPCLADDWECRSMSINDVAVVDGRAFIIRSFGVEEVTNDWMPMTDNDKFYCRFCTPDGVRAHGMITLCGPCAAKDPTFVNPYDKGAG